MKKSFSDTRWFRLVEANVAKKKLRRFKKKTLENFKDEKDFLRHEMVPAGLSQC